MKQDNAHNQRIDKGWEKMQGILESELPVRNKNKRRFFFWLFFGALISGFLLSQLFLPSKADQIDKIDQIEEPVQESSPMALDESDTSISDELAEGTLNENQNLETTNDTNDDSESSTPSLKRKATQQKQAIIESNIADGSTIKETNVTVQRQATSIVAKELDINQDTRNISQSSSGNEIHIRYRDESTMRPDYGGVKLVNHNLLIEPFELLETKSFFVLANMDDTYQGDTDASINFPSSLSMDFSSPAIIINKEKFRFFTAASAYGVAASHTNFKGWNAGLNLGFKKGKIGLSVYGKLGFLKRNETIESSVIEMSEDDLASLVSYDTLNFQDRVVEKLKFLETGLSLDWKVAPNLVFNVSPGIDYFYNSEAQQNRNLQIAGNPIEINPSSKFPLIAISSQNVVPVVSLGLSYEIAEGLYISSYYKRQFQKPIQRGDQDDYVHQYNLGMKYLF